MKINISKVKDKYTQSWGSLDWYDHINGMSARDVEIEMEHVCEQVTSEMLEMLQRAKDKLYTVQSPSTSCRMLGDEIEQLIKETTKI